MSSDSRLYFGRHPLQEALAVGASISKIFVETKSSYDFVSRLLERRRTQKVEVEEGLPKAVKAENHQGVAFKTVHKFYFPFDSDELRRIDRLVICNHVEDVHNLGSIARCAAAFGFGGIVHERTRSAELTAAVMKSSAGQAFRLNFFKVDSIVEVMPALKSCGHKIVGLDLSSKSIRFEDWQPAPKVALILGSENEGIEPDVRAQCHELIRIGMRSKVESLNVSHAAAIAMQYADSKLFKP